MTAPTIEERPSPNFDAREPGTPVDMLVIHYTGMSSAEAALERLCDPAAKVSAHYLIDEDGKVHRLVSEDKRAWHAGLAYWRGRRNINARSIGIELANPGHEFGYRPFPEKQMTALVALAGGILGRHTIPARNVVGHSDVAPDRKLDPGELFDWPRLAAAGIGIGLRPGERGADDASREVRALLTDYGYDPSARQSLSAFQRHFRPARIDGVADDECRLVLAALLAKAD